MIRLLEYAGIRGLLAGLQAIPFRTSLGLTRMLTRAAWHLDRRHRRRTIEHLTVGYGDAATRMGKRVYENLGRHISVVLQQSRNDDIPIEIRNPEILLNECRKGSGVVVVSAHLGSFSVLGRVPRRLGVKAAVVLKKQKNRHLLRWSKTFARERFGVEVVAKNDARERIPELLRQGHAVTLFADQHPVRGGIPATFYSRAVEAPAGPTVYAQRCGSPIVVATTVPNGDGHVVRFDGPVSTRGTPEEVTQRWVSILEDRIREHPEQWMWMHRRFR